MDEAKKPKQNLWRLLYPLLIFYAASIIASIVFGVIFSVGGIREAGITTIDENTYEQVLALVEEYLVKYAVYITMLQNAIVIPAAILFMKKDKQRLIAEERYTAYEKVGVIFFVLAFVLGISTAITGNNLINISGISIYYSEELETVNVATYSGGIITQIISIGILSPVAEELVYRGLFFKRLRETSSPIASAIISSVVFGFVHGNVPQMIYGFLIGLVCAFAYEKFKSIFAPIIIHIGANVFSIIGTETSVLDFVSTNNAAGLIYIIVPAALIVVIMWLIYDKVEPALADNSKCVRDNSEG